MSIQRRQPPADILGNAFVALIRQGSSPRQSVGLYPSIALAWSAIASMEGEKCVKVAGDDPNLSETGGERTEGPGS